MRNRNRLLIFALLLLYATTTDFMATTAGMVAGHDCDHPTLRVEHKCVTSSVRVKAGAQHLKLQIIPVTVLSVAVIQSEIIEISPFAVVSDLRSTPETPLSLRR